MAVAISSLPLEMTIFVSHHKVLDSTAFEPSLYTILLSPPQVVSVLIILLMVSQNKLKQH